MRIPFLLLCSIFILFSCVAIPKYEKGGSALLLAKQEKVFLSIDYRYFINKESIAYTGENYLNLRNAIRSGIQDGEFVDSPSEADSILEMEIHVKEEKIAFLYYLSISTFALIPDFPQIRVSNRITLKRKAGKVISAGEAEAGIFGIHSILALPFQFFYFPDSVIEETSKDLSIEILRKMEFGK